MNQYHSIMIYFPIEDALHIVTRFERQQLPKEEWTHEAHLVVGLYCATKYESKAFEKMSAYIRAHNESVGIINSESNGYHATITYFWIWAVRHFCSVNGDLDFNQETIDDMLWTEELANRNLWLDYYSKELMLSVEARLNLLEPDLKPF